MSQASTNQGNGDPASDNNDDPSWAAWGNGQRIVFDTSSDGGIRMEPGGLMSSGEVYDRLAADDRLRSDEERCLVYRASIAWWPDTAPESFLGSACQG